ncbi:dicarboxylate/amino acid:cation symporter [Ectobacillus panaciterrae]|uniref:dicarboxylate/amino acid:cation symporter n=1 Tax=Ectobacillus panaciterrae TaxID=363872 RepID=UPI0004011C0C|nr:cation:dicarboxylase symporter family transporter [Ectobacillus panaciterrae]
MKRIPIGLQVLIAAILGGIVGVTSKTIGIELKVLGDAFIRMIQMTIVPLVFPLIVIGVAQMKSVKTLGRLAGKAILYFEVVTTIIIVFSVWLASITNIGAGANLTGGDTSKIANLSKGIDFKTFLLEIIPKNIFDAFAQGKLLPIIFFGIFFGLGLASLAGRAKIVEDFLEAVSQIMFKVLNFVVKFSPIGVFGYIAYSMANYGWGTLKMVGSLVLVTYVGLLVVVLVIFPIIARIFGIKYVAMIREIWDLLLIAFTTRSSEVVFAPLTERLQRYGANNSVVSLVLPLGYTFNLDGGTLYIAPAILFIAHAYGLDLTFVQQLEIIGLVMMLSKGMAAVPSAVMVCIMSALTALGLPLEGIAILMAVDFIMDMARTATNVIGNSLATLVMAKSEGLLDEKKQEDVKVSQYTARYKSLD